MASTWGLTGMRVSGLRYFRGLGATSTAGARFRGALPPFLRQSDVIPADALRSVCEHLVAPSHAIPCEGGTMSETRMKP